MAFPNLLKRLFASNGAGITLRGDIMPYGTAAPKAHGTAAAGSAETLSRSDHVHPLQTTVSGNAGSATKLATKRTIDGVNFDGSANIHHYGTCSTAAGTAAKTVTLANFVLATGAEVTVRFTVTNTASNPTLNVNGTGAKAIQYRNAAISAGYLAANRTYRFVYDGSSYELVGDVDTNTTYTAASATPKAPGTAAVGTSTKYAREDHVHKLPASVAKLTAKRTIDGVQFDGSANIHHYGACTTAAGTAAKTVELSGFVLATGAEVTVKFSATNTAANPTLNVNNTGAKGIRYLGAAVAAGYLAAGRIYCLLYDGSYWNIVGDIYIHAGSVSEEQEALRLSMIGVPRYWRSTTLPPHHCWANGDFVEFADWPELKKIYDAGGFKGMLMAWDADEETQAANLGMWRPDAAKPTGLFTPNLSGQFFRNWAQGGSPSAGAYSPAGLPDLAGSLTTQTNGASPIYVGSGAFSVNGNSSYVPQGNTSSGAKGSLTMSFAASAYNQIFGGADTVMPSSVNQPLVIYLGRPA